MIIKAIFRIDHPKTLKITLKQTGIMEGADDQIHNHHRKECWELFRILPGVVATGDTEEETVELMIEAIDFHLEGLKKENLPIPEPTVTARIIRVMC